MKDVLIKRTEWFAKAAAPAKKGEKPCVMVLDLDETVFVATHYPVSLRQDYLGYRIPSKFREVYPGQMELLIGGCLRQCKFFVDPTVIREAIEFQKRGHVVFVATAGAYSYHEIANFFAHYGVTLDENCFANRGSFGHANKADYLRSSKNTVLSLGSCMLFDDNLDNNPEIKLNGNNACYFAWISPEKPFPRLSVPATYEVSLVGAYQRYYQNPKNWPQMFKQAPADEKKPESILVSSALVPA